MLFGLVSLAMQSLKCGCSTELLDVSCQHGLFVPLCPPLMLLSPAQLPMKCLEERLLCWSCTGAALGQCPLALHVTIHQWREWQSAFLCWNNPWVLPGGTVCFISFLPLVTDYPRNSGLVFVYKEKNTSRDLRFYMCLTSTKLTPTFFYLITLQNLIVTYTK